MTNTTPPKRQYRRSAARRTAKITIPCSPDELTLIHDIVSLMRLAEPGISITDAILRCVRLMRTALQPK